MRKLAIVIVSAIIVLAVVLILAVYRERLLQLRNTRLQPIAEAQWRSIKLGDDIKAIKSALGEPLAQIESDAYTVIEFQGRNGVNKLSADAAGRVREGLYRGLSKTELYRQLGAPAYEEEFTTTSRWLYSQPIDANKDYKIYEVMFDTSGTVIRITQSYSD